MQGERTYDLEDIGFWYKNQPNLKKGECIKLKSKTRKKKGRGGRSSRKNGSNQSGEDPDDVAEFELFWEVKKCSDRKEFLCEKVCDAGGYYTEVLYVHVVYTDTQYTQKCCMYM